MQIHLQIHFDNQKALYDTVLLNNHYINILILIHSFSTSPERRRQFVHVHRHQFVLVRRQRSAWLHVLDDNSLTPFT
jgi:hypothetical protein